MLATALFNRGTGSKGSPEEKCLQSHHMFVYMFVFHFILVSITCLFPDLSPSPSPPADFDSLHRCSAPWSSWPAQKSATWPWQNAAVSSTHAHYWRKGRLRQRNYTTLLRQGPGGRLSTLTPMCCMFMWFTWVPWVNPGHHRAEGPIHKVVGLCHYGFLHRLPPRHKHCFVSSQTNAEHIPINISKLWMQRQRIGGLLSSMWLRQGAYFRTIVFCDTERVF